jgi:uncharacterized protein
MLQITLAFAAAAALLNVWLALRIGEVRRRDKISHGDGGNALLQRRMRAQLNFVEFTPFVLILCLLVEASFGAQIWLAALAGIYIIGRIMHGVGMDAEVGGMPRVAGIFITLLVSVALAGAALFAVYVSMTSHYGTPMSSTEV